MSVETFDPRNPGQGVRMTPEAAEHTRRQLGRAGARAVRLSVTESGCTGYKYRIDYVTDPAPEDLEFHVAEGLSVYVEPGAMPLVRGTEIDLEVEGLNRLLRFRNPNAQAECGCGESFGV
ncbi:MAG: iron-sulfur cluster assembly accessory protein [Pseudomonadota bacterium]|nr:iron-sulfur cluster assembly accessory protein [Pseudomonadota bacterium]